MSVRILDVREVTKPISSSIANAYIDFSKMTLSLVAVVTDVIRDGRQGFAYAGSLDPTVVAEVLDDARDNAAFGDADAANGVADPDGAPYVELDLFRPGLASVPTTANAGHYQQLCIEPGKDAGKVAG